MKPKTLLHVEKADIPVSGDSEKIIDRRAIKLTTQHDFYVTAKEITNILGITSLTFTNWLKAGKFKGIRILPRSKGTTYKFVKSDFEEWLNKSMM
jgi:excisionase family DNA binding protein